MRKPFIIIVSIILTIMTFCFVLTSCSSKQAASNSVSYQDGYDKGYDSGFDEGYNYGREDDAFFNRDDNMAEIAYDLEYEAVHYAVEQGGWHPEEACMIIEAYQNNEPFYKNGSPPSEQDYLDAIDSLIYFYEYFYCNMYE